MERRDFLIKSGIAAAAVAVAPKTLLANESAEYSLAVPQGSVNDYKVTKDETKNGIRTVVATPSAKVCSKQVDIEIDAKNKTIVSCKFTGGCPGNAVGLCSLIKGMKVSDVITKLKGTPCAKRGTSCPDQLAMILASLK